MNKKCICNVEKDPDPKENKRSLKYVIEDWLNTPVTREQLLRTYLILGQVILDIAVIIKARKRK